MARQILATDFTNLKTKVKAEMLRRNQVGSVAAYGSVTYDYTVAPTSNTAIRAEHLDKNLTPMKAVNGTGLPNNTPIVLTESEIAIMETKINAWATRVITDYSASDCASSCTGTCYTGCSGACYGCGGSCSTNCTSCSGGCTSCYLTCTGSCSTECGDGCGGCDTGCYTGCTGCGTGCQMTCISGCLGGGY